MNIGDDWLRIFTRFRNEQKLNRQRMSQRYRFLISFAATGHETKKGSTLILEYIMYAFYSRINNIAFFWMQLHNILDFSSFLP